LFTYEHEVIFNLAKLTSFSFPTNTLDFVGEWVNSHITGSKIRYFSKRLRRSYLIQSSAITSTLIVMVIGIVVSIYVVRFTITPAVGVTLAQLIASVANAVQIQVLNYVYSFIAHRLTRRENHRTNSQVRFVTYVFVHRCIMVRRGLTVAIFYVSLVNLV
jgi:hypothetical protein